MIANRSMPAAVVIPELAYRDVSEAVGWLCDSFGFTFTVSLIEEGTFDRIEAAHAMSLFDLHFKYCDVISVDEFYSELDARSGSGA